MWVFLSMRSTLLSQLIREHLLVMPVPVALKALLGIVFLFEPEEVYKLRVASFDLLSGCPTMVGQVIPSIVLDGPVYDSPEFLRRFLLAILCVHDVQIANNA